MYCDRQHRYVCVHALTYNTGRDSDYEEQSKHWKCVYMYSFNMSTQIQTEHVSY